MLRNDLLNSGYHFDVKEPKKVLINMLWAILAVFFMALTALFFFAIFAERFENLSLPYIEFNAAALNIIFVATPFVYFFFKEILISLFCAGKSENPEIKLSGSAGMPVHVSREAFRTWQVVVIYLLPAAVLYPALIFLSLVTGGNMNIFILDFIMLFFISFDLTLVIYALFLKARYNAEYISVNGHIYSVTLYAKKYIADKKYIAAADKLTKNLNEFAKDRIKIKKAGFIAETPAAPAKKRLISAKKIFAFLVSAGILAAAGSYIIIVKNGGDIFYDPGSPEDYASYLEYCDNLKPVIKKYTGDIFSDPYTAKTGKYTGFGSLAGGNIIYCGDDDSAIYFDSKNDSVMRLGDNDEPERLCVYEECHGNTDEYCGHMPDFASNGCYSDGVLYGARQYWSNYKKNMDILKSYIVRYDIEKNTMDKLIEFEMGDDDVYIRRTALDGGYLYVWVSAGYDEYLKKEADALEDMMDLTVARIDLADENACVIYSENSGGKEKAMELSRFHEGYIYGSVPPEVVITPPAMFPVSGIIYRCGTDMQSFGDVIDLGYYTIRNIRDGTVEGYVSIIATQIDLYDTYIYYSVSTGAFCRYNMKTNKTEELTYSIQKFYIDGEFLYYTASENSVLYKVRIDGDYTDFENKITYINFADSTAVYTPEPGYSLGEWSVKNDNIYAVLYRSGGNLKSLVRININSFSTPYIFW